MSGAVSSVEEGAGTGDVGSGAASPRTAEVPAPGLAASARLPAVAVMATAAAASNGVEGGGVGGVTPDRGPWRGYAEPAGIGTGGGTRLGRHGVRRRWRILRARP